MTRQEQKGKEKLCQTVPKASMQKKKYHSKVDCILNW